MAYNIHDLKFYYEPEPEFAYLELMRFIACGQLVLEVLTIFHVIYVIGILNKLNVCHLNFRVLSYLFLMELVMKAATNIIVLLKLISGKTFLQTSTDYIIANSLQVTCNYVYYFSPISIFVERFVSLLWAKRYENFFSKTFIVALCIGPYILSLYLTANLLLLQEWINILYSYIALNAIIMIGWIAYFTIYVFTKKYFTTKSSIQSLSERYQRYENLRANRTVFWYAMTSWMSIIVGFVYIQTLANYKKFWPSISDVNMNAMSRLVLDTLQAFIFLIFPISFMFAHPKLLQKYLEPLNSCRAKTKIYSTATSFNLATDVKSLTGQPLIYKNAQDQYFKMLATDWGDNFHQSCPHFATTTV